MTQNLLPTDNPVGKRRQQPTGCGAAALWAALEAIAIRDGRRGEVILPDLVCSSVLEAVLAAGFTPRLANVEKENYCLSPETIKPHLSSETSAVLVVHLFGHVAPIEAIAQLTKDSRVRLIEDAAQGVGGQTESRRPIGSSGDFAFLSFHASKTIRGSGGLLLYDDDAWTEPVDRVISADWPKTDSPSEQLLRKSLRDLYHGLGQALRAERLSPGQAARAFRDALPGFRSLLFRRFDDRQENVGHILRDWHDLRTRIASRNLIASALSAAFANLPVARPPIKTGDAIWRYSVLFPSREAADRFVVALRQRGGLVSQLYYPLHELYQPDLLLQTKSWASLVVNLWVDETVSESYVDLVRDTAQRTLAAEN